MSKNFFSQQIKQYTADLRFSTVFEALLQKLTKNTCHLDQKSIFLNKLINIPGVLPIKMRKKRLNEAYL